MSPINNKGSKKKGKLIPFLVASALFHILLFLLILLYAAVFVPLEDRNKPQFVEITELPVPKEKETAPPKETKRLAERSRQVPEEKTKDDFTKLGNPTPPAVQPKQPQVQQKRQEAKKSEPKKERAEKSTKKNPQIASLPKDIEANSEPIAEKSKNQEQPKTVTTRDLFSQRREQIAQANPEEFQGSREGKREDTVDLNTTEFKYLSYFLKLKRQIEGVWNYPEASRARGEQGELFLVFTIRKDGYLEEVNLRDSSGYVRLDDEALRAIRVAAPFSPFPPSWGLDRLNIRAVFQYRMSFGWNLR
ncbi:MAG: energy transducer TonB [Deltaproteobacteria bacterium]